MDFQVIDLKSHQAHTVSFPESAYEASLRWTPEFGSPTFRFSYQSLTTPVSIYDYDMAKHSRALRKRDEVRGGYDPEQFVTRRFWVKARDGAEVPVTIAHRKGLEPGTPRPLLLMGYGAYGVPTSPMFASHRLTLLNRGVVLALAHIRGGNDLGEHWHDDGMLMKKKNSFTDFVDVGEWLVEKKWTSKALLMARGGSAGGLLMGAVANLRPDLFRAIQLAVPFVDLMNTMMDASLPLTVGEYLEWGNPNERTAFNYMRSYSPYDNLEKKAYPAILVTTSLNDSQVGYWEPAKYVAKLRTLKTDSNQLLLKCTMEAGHGGPSGRYNRLRQFAFEDAWLLWQAGLPLK
jgi:oligopeptidase B